MSSADNLCKQFGHISADDKKHEKLPNMPVFKEAKSATMNIFRKKKYFLFKSFVKVKLSYVFTINLFTTAETARKIELSYKIGVCFLLLVIICVPPIIIDS